MPEQRDTDRSRWQAILPDLQRSYADAVLGGSESAAERVVREAIEAGVPEAVISGEVIAPTMRAIGDLWERGLLSVADEHLATEISIRVLALQREAFRATSRRGAHRVMLAGMEGERHGLGLTMAGSVLVHAGYDVRMLGPDLPMPDLASAVDRHRPSVVGLSVTQPGWRRSCPRRSTRRAASPPGWGSSWAAPRPRRRSTDLPRGARLPARRRRRRARRGARAARAAELTGSSRAPRAPKRVV